MCLWFRIQTTPASSKRSPGYRLLTARHVTRPQSEFRDKIDNSHRPFVPKITMKPNALRPLAGDGAIVVFTYDVCHVRSWMRLEMCLYYDNVWYMLCQVFLERCC